MPNKRVCDQLSWATGAGHDAQTDALVGVSGKCTRIDVIASSVTGNPTLTLTITDTDNSGTYCTVASIPDGTHSILLSESGKSSGDADFNPFVCADNKLTISIDPSADAGGSSEELTVDVELYFE